MIALHDLLGDTASNLGRLVAKAQALGKLQEILQDVLPTAFRADVCVLHYYQGILTLGASSGAQATALRFELPGIQSALQRVLEGQLPIEQIVVRIVPSGHR